MKFQELADLSIIQLSHQRQMKSACPKQNEIMGCIGRPDLDMEWWVSTNQDDGVVSYHLNIRRSCDGRLIDELSPAQLRRLADVREALHNWRFGGKDWPLSTQQPVALPFAQPNGGFEPAGRPTSGPFSARLQPEDYVDAPCPSRRGRY